VADEFSGTKSGKLANAYIGICYAQKGEYEKAATYLSKFNANDELISPALMGTLGNCYAQLGQLDKAASTLMKAADKADSQALSPIYLIQAGQIYEKLGKQSEAVKAYTLVKDKYFNSYQSMDIDKYIERAQSK
jgi:tetratricopeptide (TPR) repeat protein